MNDETNEPALESYGSARWRQEEADEAWLSDPERAIGFGALGPSLETFYCWFSRWSAR